MLRKVGSFLIIAAVTVAVAQQQSKAESDDLVFHTKRSEVR